LSLTLNAEELLQELDEVETRANEVEELVEEVEAQSETSFNQVLGMLHAGWLATQGLVRATGGTIQTVFRTVVGTTLGAISMIYPVLQAALAGGLASMNPWAVAQALLGLASIGLATTALIAAQAQQKEFSDSLRGANMALHGIQSMIGVFGF